MSQRSKSVTTILNACEIRNGHHLMVFGDLKDLKIARDGGFVGFGLQHDQSRSYNDGNYSVSILNYPETKPIVVVHHENVDPTLVAEKTLEKPIDVPDAEKTAAIASKKTVFHPSDWFSSRRPSSSRNGNATNTMKRRGGKKRQQGKRKRAKQTGGNSGGGGAQSAASGPSKLGENLTWKDNQEVAVNKEGPDDVNQTKGIDLTGLLYFVRTCCLNGISFEDRTPRDPVEIAYSTDGVYKLAVNGMEMGIAINLVAIFDRYNNGAYTGILFQDPDNTCFALVIRSSCKISNKQDFTLPMSSFLYDTIYRSFTKSGNTIENPYYGPNGTSRFDFNNLPNNVFVKILLQLPLKQRVHSRRVSRHWLAVSNTALSIDTKNVDTAQPFYYKMKPDHIKSYLPLVSACLEVLTLGDGLSMPAVKLDTFSIVTSFPVLRKLHFGSSSFSDDDALFDALDKSPKLKVLTASIPRKLPIPGEVHRPYKVEELSLWGENATDSQLVAFLDCFPDLSYLCIMCEGYLTASCISWVLEKYGSKLRHFEISGNYAYHEFGSPPPFGYVTGIQTCTNLTYISLDRTNLISDGFMIALASGCVKLETLDVSDSTELTNEGLSALAALPNLTRLDISGGTDMDGPRQLSEGVTAIAREGRLVELVAECVTLSSACLKTIIRHCQHLKLLDISDSLIELTRDDAIEMVQAYGTRSMEPRLIVRSSDAVWRSVEVLQAINEIQEDNRHHLTIKRGSGTGGFLIDGVDETEDDDYHDWYDDDDDYDYDYDDDEESFFEFEFGYDSNSEEYPIPMGGGCGGSGGSDLDEEDMDDGNPFYY